MNIEEIDKWLDNEYGVSYTRLEELHDFLIERNMKYQDKIEQLQQENKQLKEEKPYLYTNTEWEDILEYQGKSYIELDRYKKREKEIMDKYFHQSKYASEMEDKYISANGILTELEEWLKQEIENIKTNYSQVNGNYFNINYKIETYEDTLEIIQKLKEKYK